MISRVMATRGMFSAQAKEFILQKIESGQGKTGKYSLDQQAIEKDLKDTTVVLLRFKDALSPF
jgi:hypothetical protein